MVKTFVIAGAFVLSADAARDLISKQSRFLIQSVVKEFNPAQQVFEAYKETEFKAQDFCEAPMSLVALDPVHPKNAQSGQGVPSYEDHKALPLFKSLTEEANKFNTGIKAVLDSVKESMSKDVTRWRNDLNKYWTLESANFHSIVGAMENLAIALKTEKESAEALNQKKGSMLPSALAEVAEPLPSALAEVFPVPAGGEPPAQFFGINQADRFLTSMKNKGKNLLGTMSHRPEMWEAMVKDYGNNEEKLRELFSRLKDTEARLGGMFPNVGNVQQVTSESQNGNENNGGEVHASVSDQAGDQAAVTGAVLSQDPSQLKKISEQIAEQIASAETEVKDGNAEQLKGFGEFLSSFAKSGATGADRINPMAVLTTALNFLHMRKDGIKKAKEFTVSLKAAINAERKKLITSIQKKAVSVNETLGNIKTLVYAEAEKLPGVKIEKASTEKLLSSLDLNDVELKKTPSDAVNLLIPMINKVVNSVWRAHTHMFGFFKLVKGKIEEIGKGDADNIEKINVEDMKAIQSAAECLLYGRVDAMFVGLKLNNAGQVAGNNGEGEEDKLCGDVHNAGARLMEIAEAKWIAPTFVSGLIKDATARAIVKLQPPDAAANGGDASAGTKAVGAITTQSLSD